MMKTALCACMALVCGLAQADDLADAQKLWDNKKFNEAFQAFSQLAQAGNPAAQLQLGEMYGFGEGTAEDMAAATRWLEKAAQAGVKEAPESLALVRRRAAHKADIQYYIQQFDGAEARYEKFNCVAPNLPDVSKTIREIKAVDDELRSWRECYGRFATNLNSKAHAANTIPAQILDLMNQDEFNRAGARIDTVYAEIARNAQTVADGITLRSDAWRKATEEYVQAYDKQQQAELLRLRTLNEVENKAYLQMIQTNAKPTR